MESFDYLLTPLVSEGERAFIVLQMARGAYTVWARECKIEVDWDALAPEEKQKWGKIVRGSFRVMLSLMSEIAETGEN